MTAYCDTQPLREMMGAMDEDDHLSFCYTSDKKSRDAGAWLFDIYGKRSWRAKMGHDLGVLEFFVPLLYQERQPLDFLQLFTDFARQLEPEQGHAGHAYNFSPASQDNDEPSEAFVTACVPGLDVGTACLLTSTSEFKPTRIKTVSWLTLLSNERLVLAGGLDALRVQSPSSHFASYRYGDGMIIQAGVYPYIAGDAEDSRPAPYMLLNHALKGIRYETADSPHGGSRDDELRLVGRAANQWLKRLDVEDDELSRWRNKLLNIELRLGATDSLPERSQGLTFSGVRSTRQSYAPYETSLTEKISTPHKSVYKQEFDLSDRVLNIIQAVSTTYYSIIIPLQQIHDSKPKLKLKICLLYTLLELLQTHKAISTGVVYFLSVISKVPLNWKQLQGFEVEELS